LQTSRGIIIPLTEALVPLAPPISPHPQNPNQVKMSGFNARRNHSASPTDKMSNGGVPLAGHAGL